MADQVEQIDNKKEQIIAVALKHFSHFGVSKTTMNDIAEDLAISKALLYYYFPDKLALVLEVGKSMFQDFFESQKQALSNSENFKTGIHALLNLRLEFGKNHFMMHSHDIHLDVNIRDPRFTTLTDHIKSEELALITAFIDQHKLTQEIRDVDSKRIAQLLVDTFTGVWISEVHLNSRTMMLSDEQFETIKEKSKLLVDIFYEGIRSHQHGN